MESVVVRGVWVGIWAFGREASTFWSRGRLFKFRKMVPSSTPFLGVRSSSIFTVASSVIITIPVQKTNPIFQTSEISEKS